MAKRRRDESPERQAIRELVNGYLKENSVKNGTDVNALMREIMSVILESSLDGEMDEELGYFKYDFRNKETDNSRNGYTLKHYIWNRTFPATEMGSSSQYQNTLTQGHGRKNHFHICQRNDNRRY